MRRSGKPPRAAVERGADLGRVVRVVVDDQRAVVVAEDLEAAVDAEELRQAGGDASRRRRRARAPTAIAASALRTLCSPGTKSLKKPTPGTSNERAALVELEVDRAQVRALGQAVADGGDRSRVAQQARHVLVIARSRSPRRARLTPPTKMRKASRMSSKVP